MSGRISGRVTGQMGRLLDRLAFRRGLARWSGLAARAGSLPAEDLRDLRQNARLLRREVDRALFAAEERLTAPAPAPLRGPPGTDWLWRPDLWRSRIAQPGIAADASRTPICEGATLFHDCRLPELVLRQIRNPAAGDGAPFGLSVEVFHFDGSFLSLVLDLPAEAAAGLSLRHLIRLEAAIEAERPLEIYARLNIKHGPNVEQIVRELPRGGDETRVEFDLAYTRINEMRVERLWVDLIFGKPGMNRVHMRDVTVGRRPRAEV